MNGITRAELTERLYGTKDETEKGGEEINRRDAAGIIHLFLRERGIEDLPDISGAAVLKDLYDCRVCVNHIAQVYLRGIMDGIRISAVSEDFLIFDGKMMLTEEELDSICGRIQRITNL